MAVALLLLPGTPVEPLDELAPDEGVEGLHDRAEAVEAVEALGPLLELAGRLRAAEHEDAQDRGGAGLEPELLVEQLPVLRGATPRAARNARPAPAGEALERLVDLPLVVADDRIAVRRLIAREPEPVQGQRVLVGGRSLLSQQATEHAQLDRVGVHARTVRRAVAAWTPAAPAAHGPSNVFSIVELSARSSYRVADGLLAGAYPAGPDDAAADRRARALADEVT